MPKGCNKGKDAWKKLESKPRAGPDCMLGAAEVVLLGVIVCSCILGFGFTKATIVAAGAALAKGKGLQKKMMCGGQTWFKTFKKMKNFLSSFLVAKWSSLIASVQKWWMLARPIRSAPHIPGQRKWCGDT